MLAIADDNTLYLLEFIERKNLNLHIQKLLHQKKISELTSSLTPPLISIQHELDAYFKGQLKTFNTSITFRGTSFQQKVWLTLCNIPYGETRSYAKQANMLEHSKAIRAVANANANNSFAIVVPCHRVIRTDKTLGGYAAGIERKAWLLKHEQTQLQEVSSR